MLTVELIETFSDVETRAKRQNWLVSRAYPVRIRYTCGIAALHNGGGGVNRMLNIASEVPVSIRMHRNAHAQPVPEGITVALSADT